MGDARASPISLMIKEVYPAGVSPIKKWPFMTDLSDYSFQMLQEGDAFTPYRARQRGDSVSILTPTPIPGLQTPTILERLNHKLLFANELDPARAVRALTLAHHNGCKMLVLEDPSGHPLSGLLGQALELKRFLSLAVSLPAALRHFHQRGLFHKDIKPANLLVDTADNVRLMGFGIASRFSRECQAPAPPEVIAGTLAYMASEQTGRMNRSIDARSDLYSRGVYPVRDAHRGASVYGFVSHGVDPLSHRAAAAQRTDVRNPGSGRGNCPEATRQERRGPLPNRSKHRGRPPAVSDGMGCAALHRRKSECRSPNSTSLRASAPKQQLRSVCADLSCRRPRVASGGRMGTVSCAGTKRRSDLLSQQAGREGGFADLHPVSTEPSAWPEPSRRQPWR
jgi:serine/threonine protein kinase